MVIVMVKPIYLEIVNVIVMVIIMTKLKLILLKIYSYD